MDRYRYLDMSFNEEKYILDNIDNKKEIKFEPLLFEEFLTKLNLSEKSKIISKIKINNDILKEEKFIFDKKNISNYKKIKIKNIEKQILNNLTQFRKTSKINYKNKNKKFYGDSYNLKTDDLFFLIYGDELINCNYNDLRKLYTHYKLKLNNLILKKQVNIINGNVIILKINEKLTGYSSKTKFRKMKEINELRNKIYKRL